MCKVTSKVEKMNVTFLIQPFPHGKIMVYGLEVTQLKPTAKALEPCDSRAE